MNLTIDRLPGESRPARRPLSSQDEKSVEYGLEEAEEWETKRETRRAIRLYERDTVQCRFRARPRYRVPLSSDVAVSGSSITNVSLKNCLSDSSRAIVLQMTVG